ncbi:MAG: homocysteine S-methyltransferase family protein [Lachnospiraceae bacterium]|nr:homocysteine S-methyltransferase family protein [Lachnospiraceae bacterium]
MDIKNLFENEYLLLDGAMGTMLQKKGMPLGAIPETLNVTNPDWVIDVHRQYIREGSRVIYANTFGANSLKLAGSGYSVPELVGAAIQNARRAAEGSGAFVALDIGPIGQLLEPTGALTFEEAYEVFSKTVEAGRGADLIVIETMTDLYEAKAAVLAAKEHSDLPVFVTMTFEENRRTFTGCSVSAMCLTLEGLGVDALGVNCSLGPAELLPIVEEIARWTSLPIIVKPNAGLPDPETNAYNVLPEEFAAVCKKMLSFGARILGGCCGTNPSYIGKLREMLKEASEEGLFQNAAPDSVLSLCTPLKTVRISEPRVIGERINPTGKKRFREALAAEDMDYILSQAFSQIEAGADLLDVNVGAPGIDEAGMMVKTVKALQSVTDLPLQIDSTKPEVLEAALRVYNGKALVNSVNGEEASLRAILPLIKKYGAAVVCLTLDENGIPPKAEERFAIAEKIMKRALSFGIKKENILIDCLVLTVSAEQKAAMETLKAVRMVKEKLGLKTVLGVSNISFGLPNRLSINTSFFTMALYAGLDLPIMNPNVPSMMWAMKAYKALAAIDENSLGFISWSRDHEPDDVIVKKLRAELAGSVPKAPAAVPAGVPALDIRKAPLHPAGCSCPECAGLADEKRVREILKAMETGMKAEGRRLTAGYLKECDSMSIINKVLIPALDTVGEKFEKGRIFLPQLILAADVAKECFDEIKSSLSAGGTGAAKGKILLATVKGDIHDIGKNIVKVILENYGYEVLDLGRDVPPDTIVEATLREGIRLVGLSALMTTTLGSMEETIRRLRAAGADCRIMVGGAVLTPDYAKKIGADFYAKDAKQSADIAKEVLG